MASTSKTSDSSTRQGCIIFLVATIALGLVLVFVCNGSSISLEGVSKAHRQEIDQVLKEVDQRDELAKRLEGASQG